MLLETREVKFQNLYFKSFKPSFKIFLCEGGKKKTGLRMLAISVFMFNKMILGLLVVVSFKKIIKVYLLMC